MSFKMTNPFIDLDVFIDHHFQDQIKNFRMAMMRYEQESIGLLDPDSPSLGSYRQALGSSEPQTAWSRLFSHIPGYQSINEFAEDAIYTWYHPPTHMGDPRIKKIRKGAGDVLSGTAALAINAFSPFSPNINALVHAGITTASNHAVAEALKKHVVPGPRPIFAGLTKRQMQEMYRTIMFFCKILAYGGGVGLVSAAVAKPVLGESAQEFSDRITEYMLGKPQQAMELLGFYNTLKELPEKEREELIKSDRLATILEGGQPESRLQTIAQHPITQAVMSGIEAVGPNVHPMLQAAQGVHSLISTGNPIPLANAAMQYITQPAAIVPAATGALAIAPASVQKASSSSGYYRNPATGQYERIPGPPPLNPPPPPTTRPKASTTKAAPGDHRLEQSTTRPKASTTKAAPGDHRLEQSAPYLVPTIRPEGEGVSWVMGRYGPIKVVKPTRRSGTGKPKKKDVVATCKPLLPYFDISSHPYFIKS
jgi:hypothetical protein